MTPRRAGCLGVHVAVRLRQATGHRVADPCLDAACGPKVVRRRAGSRKNHRDEPAAGSSTLTEAPGPDAGRPRLAGAQSSRSTTVVSRMPRGTSRGSIAVDEAQPAPTYSKPRGLPPPLPARCEVNPLQPVQVRPAWSRLLAAVPPCPRGARPSAMPVTTMGWPKIWGAEPRLPTPSQRPADPSTPESDPPSPDQDSPGRSP
jgi:hypothetical protein